MRFVFIFILAFASAFAQFPASDCDQIVTHGGYTLCYSEKHEQPKWVQYKLEVGDVLCKKKRKNDFRSDPKVLTGSASVSDYKRSGYDRGHLAPAADFCDISSTFYMSNMSPQRPRFNRGVWKKLEVWVRDQVLTGGSLFVVTGPVLHDSLETIGKNEVSVPEFYYKIVFSETVTIAYLLPNKGSRKKLSSFMVPTDSIEILTGIHFFTEYGNVK